MQQQRFLDRHGQGEPASANQRFHGGAFYRGAVKGTVFGQTEKKRSGGAPMWIATMLLLGLCTVLAILTALIVWRLYGWLDSVMSEELDDKQQKASDECERPLRSQSITSRPSP